MLKKKSIILQMEPKYGEAEIMALNTYMQSGGWLTEHIKTREFEELIAKKTNSKFCSVVSNGTVSLSLALYACNIGSGDDVIVPNYTMAGTASSVLMTGANVVFCDVDPQTACLNLEIIKKTITTNTKAIMLVSMNGRAPFDIDDIVNFCMQKDIFLIEDAAQSLGSFKNKKHLGTFGDIGSFSFSMPKIISTGNGGAIVTDNEALFNKICKLKDFGREERGSDNYLSIGWNFKFTDIQAVIGLEQLKVINKRIARRREIFKLYHKRLSTNKNIKFLETDISSCTPMFVDILVPKEKRDELICYLDSMSIKTRLPYPALNTQPAFKKRGNYSGSKFIADGLLWIPSSLKLTNEDIFYVCDCINNFFN